MVKAIGGNTWVLIDWCIFLGVDCNGLNSSSEKQLCQMVINWIEIALDERPLERLTENVRNVCVVQSWLFCITAW